MNLKHLLFAITFCLVGLSADAQFYFYFDYNYNRVLVDHVNRDKELVKKEGISSRTVEVKEYDKNGNITRSRVSYRVLYNENGQIKREEYYFPNGRLSNVTNYTFNEKGQVIEKEVHNRKHRGPSYKWTVNYHNDTLISSVHAYNKKGKHAWGYRYLYNTNNQVKEQRRYHKSKLAGRIEYDYYDDLSKKEVRYYDDSLDLEKTYQYDCGIGNSLLPQKQKDTLTKCSRTEELADGTKRYIEETRDEKGRIIRNVYDTNLAGQWYEMRSYDSKNRLKYTYRRDKKDGNKTKVVHQYYKRGKAKSPVVYITWKDQFGFDSYEHYEDETMENLQYSSYTFFKK